MASEGRRFDPFSPHAVQDAPGKTGEFSVCFLRTMVARECSGCRA